MSDLAQPDELMEIEHPDRITAATFSPDGNFVVTACNDQQARIWDTRTGAALGVPIPHDARIPIVWSGNEQRFVASPTLSSTQLWDCSGNLCGAPIDFDGAITARGFSHNGEYRAVLQGSTLVGYWNLETGQPFPKGELLDHEGEGASIVDFSPDMQAVIVARFHQVYVREVATGKTLQRLPHQGLHTVARYSPDGSVILTGGANATANLWDAKSFQLIGNPIQHQGVILGAVFNPDGNLLLTRAPNQTQLIDVRSAKPLGWRLPLDSKLEVIGFMLLEIH